MRYKRKSSGEVEAIQLKQNIIVIFKEESVDDGIPFEEGDWLVQHEDGEIECMCDAIFQKEYEPIKEQTRMPTGDIWEISPGVSLERGIQAMSETSDSIEQIVDRFLVLGDIPKDTDINGITKSVAAIIDAAGDILYFGLEKDEDETNRGAAQCVALAALFALGGLKQLGYDLSEFVSEILGELELIPSESEEDI